MTTPTSKRERWIVIALLVGFSLVLFVALFELLRSFVTPEALLSLVGGEGPPSELCAYRSLNSYRVSNASLAGLNVCAILLLLPFSAAKTRIPALVVLGTLITSFGFWYEWGCRTLCAA